MAIFFAFCCLGFSAVNDFVFKLFARKARPRGIFVALIGVVWLGLMIWLPRDPQTSLGATWLWGSISGLLSVAANLLLIEAMGEQSAGLCATVYRLNLVLVVAGAWLFLGETIDGTQLLGVFLALMAILAFLPGRNGMKVERLGFWLVVLAAVLRAGMGLTYRYGFLHGADRNGVTIINSLFWIAGGLYYALRRERHLKCPVRKTLFYGTVSGVLVAGIIFFMAASLQYGEAGIVLPIAQMSFLGTYLLGMIFLKEKLTPRGAFALGAGIFGILLLSSSH